MAVEWTQHRFTGGVLALDTTNTVVLRNDPARRFDLQGCAGGNEGVLHVDDKQRRPLRIDSVAGISAPGSRLCKQFFRKFHPMHVDLFPGNADRAVASAVPHS